MTYTTCSNCGRKILWVDRRYAVTFLKGSEQIEVAEYCTECFVEAKDAAAKS